MNKDKCITDTEIQDRAENVERGKEIVRIRKALRVTQAQFGFLLDVQQRLLSSAETGRLIARSTSIEILNKARALPKDEETITARIQQMPKPETMNDEEIKAWRWLNDRDNYASVMHEPDGVRLVWHVSGFGRCDTKAPTIVLAVKSAMTTRFTATEYFPGKV